MNAAPLHNPPQPAPAARKAHGSAEGTASLTLSVLAAASMYWTAPLSLIAALFTRPDEGPGDRDWVAPLVLWSCPVLFGLVAITLGVVALRVCPPRSRGSRRGMAGLSLAGAEAAVGLGLVLVHGDPMILF